MAVEDDSEQVPTCFERFPFTDDFSDVFGDEVTLDYLGALARVLQPAIEVAEQSLVSGGVQSGAVVTLVFAVAALARVRVVQAYAEEVRDADLYGKDRVLVAIQSEWQAMVEREQMVFVRYLPVVRLLLGDAVESLWEVSAVTSMMTARSLLASFPLVVSDLTVTVVGEVLVTNGAGVSLASLASVHLDKPVLPQQAYRRLLQLVKQGADSTSSVAVADVLGSVVGSHDLGCGPVGARRVSEWLWLVITNTGRAVGYCYQLMVAPSGRAEACYALGAMPLVSDVLWYFEQHVSEWAEQDAVVQGAKVLHVSVAGNPPLGLLRANLQARVGIGDAGEVDYFARALVDSFIAKHTCVVDADKVVAPVDCSFEALTLDTGHSSRRGFVDVAAAMYAAVGESVSPRTETSQVPRGGMVSAGDHLSERDNERVKEVYSRLADGAVIPEDYFHSVRRRFRARRGRPRLSETSGRSYHVFGGFPADGGGGTGPWKLDDMWDVPGWISYVAVFRPKSDTTLSFIAPDGSDDVRMDCTGDGALEFGDCKVATQGAVLWFSNSVKFRLVTKTYVDLRISVPDAGSAQAIGAGMRRYMYLPGYTVVARSFDVITGRSMFSVPMIRVPGTVCAGCHVYQGSKFVERGRHRFKLVQLASAAPVKMLLKTDPVDAFAYLSVCGMRVSSRARDYVSVLFDINNVDLYVCLEAEAELQVSVVQVVNNVEFDLTVASIRKI